MSKFCVYTEIRNELSARKSAIEAERLSLLKAADRLKDLDGALASITTEMDRVEAILAERNAPAPLSQS